MNYLDYASAREIIFTSCGTESNNTAIRAAIQVNPGKRHIITSAVEHSSVLNHCRALEKDGCRVTYLPVDRDGLLKLADLFTAVIRSGTGAAGRSACL